MTSTATLTATELTGILPRIFKLSIMDIKTTDVNGLQRVSFKDRYDQDCNIQDSSLADEACIWLGRYGARMHLTQEQAKTLLPYLVNFIENGTIKLNSVSAFEKAIADAVERDNQNGNP